MTERDYVEIPLSSFEDDPEGYETPSDYTPPSEGDSEEVPIPVGSDVSTIRAPGDIETRRKLGISDSPSLSFGEQEIMRTYGDKYSSESIVDSSSDLKLAFKWGMAQTADKKRRIIKELYGEQADVKFHDFGPQGTFEIGTKDGENWRPTAGLYDYIKDAPETAASIGMGILTRNAGFGTRLIAPSLSAGGTEFLTEKYLQDNWEPERAHPVQSALWVAAFDLGGGAAGEGVSALTGRILGRYNSPGAQAAREAADAEGLPRPTRGQTTENSLVMDAYKQWQLINEKSAAEGLKRFQALGDKLHEMVDKYGLEGFSPGELVAASQKSAFDIADSVRKLGTGTAPLAQIMPTLQSALNTFHKTSRARSDQLYEQAFKTAVSDGVEFNLWPVKSTIKKIKQGVPIETADFARYKRIQADIDNGLDVPLAEREFVENFKKSDAYERYLTPDSTLGSMIGKVNELTSILKTHGPDGVDVSALEQLAAIRRGFSEYAWEKAGTNQGRLASEVLESLDASLATPVAGASTAYKSAFDAAQQSHSLWKAVKEIKSVSKLSDADLSTYQNYVANLVRPGNSALIDLMDGMFKSQPHVMQNFKSVYVDSLLRDPASIVSKLDNFSKTDPAMLNKMIDPADQKVLRDYAETKARFDDSWISKQADKEYAANADRAVALFNGGKDTVFKNVKEFIEFGGPRAREHAKAGFLQSLLESSETEGSTLLGGRIVDGDAFIKILDQNESLVKYLFTKEELKRLRNLENYALKVRDTVQRVPPRKTGSGSADSAGTSIMTAARGADILDLPTDVSNKGVTGPVKTLFRTFLAPRVMNFILGFDKPVANAASVVGDKSLIAIRNAVRVLPNIIADDVNHSEPQPLPEVIN